MPAKRTKKAAKKPVRTAKQARSLATVEAIIEATTWMLASSGWNGVTTNTIAERAGVSVGSPVPADVIASELTKMLKLDAVS